MQVDDQSDSGLLVGPLVSPSTLLPSYENASLPGFTTGINYLSRKYRHMRRVKGDGNCFYRCYLFAFLDQLLQAHSLEATKTTAIEELGRVKTAVIKSRGKIILIKRVQLLFIYFTLHRGFACIRIL
jgi:ubiquitin thioesterase protein OTUB1